MSIYRGVSNANREIQEQWRCVDGVNRRIKEQWCGAGGVNRQVYSSIKCVKDLPIGAKIKLGHFKVGIASDKVYLQWYVANQEEDRTALWCTDTLTNFSSDKAWVMPYRSDGNGFNYTYTQSDVFKALLNLSDYWNPTHRNALLTVSRPSQYIIYGPPPHSERTEYIDCKIKLISLEELNTWMLFKHDSKYKYCGKSVWVGDLGVTGVASTSIYVNVIPPNSTQELVMVYDFYFEQHDIRPSCYISADTKILQEPDSDGCYLVYE